MELGGMMEIGLLQMNGNLSSSASGATEGGKTHLQHMKKLLQETRRKIVLDWGNPMGAIRINAEKDTESGLGTTRH